MEKLGGEMTLEVEKKQDGDRDSGEEGITTYDGCGIF